jgi:hypothetical protein
LKLSFGRVSSQDRNNQLAHHTAHAARGCTPDRHARAAASHLDLLSAFVDPGRLQAAYREAIQRGYLWHEFGDMNLII